jgi:hypothetical protein
MLGNFKEFSEDFMEAIAILGLSVLGLFFFIVPNFLGGWNMEAGG